MNKPTEANAANLSELRIEQEVRIEAPPERVFEALTSDIGA